MTNPTARAIAALAYLERSWPLLVEVKTPGTPRRWTERRPRGARPTVDRLLATAAPSPAPVVLSVLDVTQRLSALAAELAATVAAVIDPCPVPETDPPHAHLARVPSSAFVDPRPHLAFVRAHLDEADELDDRTVPWVLDLADRVVHAVERALGEVRVGQTLAALCPWCGGRTEQAPAGGERTLQVLLPDDDDEDDEPLIVCTGVSCEPPPNACGQRDRGRPAWPEREWDWLARMLHPVAGADR